MSETRKIAAILVADVVAGSRAASPGGARLLCTYSRPLGLLRERRLWCSERPFRVLRRFAVQAHLLHLRRHRRPEVEPLARTRAAGFQLLEPRHLARRSFAMPITQKCDDGRHAHPA